MANNLIKREEKMKTTKIYFLAKIQPVFFTILLGVFILSMSFPSILNAQKRVKFKDISTEIESGSATQREKINLLLKIEKRDKLYPLAIAHLHKIYLQNSRQISINKPQDDLLFLLDSSIYFTGKTISTVKKEFYEKNKGDIIGILRLPTDLSYSAFIDQVEQVLEDQSHAKVLIPSLFSNFEDAIQFLKKSDDDFQLIKVVHPNKNELFFLSDSLYTQTIEPLKSDFFDFKNSYSLYENVTDSFPFIIEKIVSKYIPIQNHNQNEHKFIGKAEDTLNVKNYQKWWLDLELTRENQIQEFWKEMNSTNRLLTNIIDTLASDTLELTQNLDSLKIENKLIKELSPTSISLTLFDYQYKRANLLQLFNSENDYSPKGKERNDIIKYYYSLKTKVKDLEKNFDLLLKSSSDSLKMKEINPFLQKQYMGEEGFVTFLEKNSKEISLHNNYCDEKIRAQILKIYFEKKFLPNYATFKDLEIALFEQPMATILEKDHFLTLKVINLENKIKYISGFQQGENKIPFVAKASGEKIVWLKPLNIKLNKGEYIHGYASQLTFDGRNLTAVVNQESNDSTHKYLFELNDEGELQSHLAFEKNKNIDFILKNNQDSLTLLGYQSQEETPQFTVEGLFGNLNSTWKLSFPYKIKLPQILSHQSNYLFIANVAGVQPDLSNSSTVNLDHFSNLMIAIISPIGEIKFQKVFQSEASQFFTHTLELENKAILILGFNGSMDLNNFENKSLFTMEFDPQQELPVVGDGLGKR